MSIAIVPVVLCGGSGTRLWPLSREKYPKQLLSLVNDDSLLQATLRRVQGEGVALQVGAPLVICNEEYRFVIAEQLRLMGVSGRVILEPVGKNTAPALTVAALEATQDGQDPILLVMPADHVIVETAIFQKAVKLAATQAEQGNIVTFGIVPDSPETGYGYIQKGESLIEDNTAFKIAQFVEKPDLQTAGRYVDSGEFLWNSGLFMMRASVWLQAMMQCRPDILQAVQQAWEQKQDDGDFVRVDKVLFSSCPSDSIDYAVMERVANAETSLPKGVVVPLAAGWSDVGAWDSYWKVLPQDDEGNASKGDVVLTGCENILALSSSRLVACVGVSNIAVVETSDAVLVIDKNQTQEVKKVVELLKVQARPEAHLHRKVHRPWGWYDSIDMGERFQVKRIVVNPGATLSLQMHHHRAEHWIVVTGTAEVTRGDEVFLVSENQSTYIPLGVTHRLANPGRLPLEMIEVQSGAYLGEDDIVRFNDQYGRS
ncbi:mannose-1-phosphate guanylyltransferase/mannose-6-phosphate isomerase [Methylobacillus sp. Pita1]|uniref:mannose-1-phosphate guanylyltransferase/mannose-6-phosphate isomerase n=1 Tax=Methylobacillus sp. Pita1 TaxID=3382642 RepID=UPI0038B68EC8